MRHAVQPFWSASDVSLALAGGQTATYWQRELLQSTAGLDALWRSCAWVEALHTTHPRLHNGPLWGHCLEALTGPVARPAEPEPAETLPRRFRSTRPERAQKSARGAAARDDSWVAPLWPGSSEGPTGAHRSQSARETRPGPSPSTQPERAAGRERIVAAPLPFQLESQASQALLSRLTGAPVSAGGAHSPRYRVPQEPNARTRALPSVPREPGARQSWLHRLARRAERSLHQDGFDAPSTSRLAPSERPEYDRAPPLADQWATSLNGQSVSTDLLAYLTYTPVVGGEGSRRNLASETASQRPPGSRPAGAPALAQSAPPWHTKGGLASTDPLAQLVGALGAYDGGSGRTLRSPGARPVGSPAPVVTGDDQPWSVAKGPASADLRAHPPDAPVGDGAGFERQALQPAINRRGDLVGALQSSARIAPPGTALSSPALLPSQRVGVPSPPVAAATAWQGAKQEQADAVQDDLNALAAQVKHILDEQARRHGIDV